MEERNGKPREEDGYSVETHMIYGLSQDPHWDYSHHLVPPLSSSATFSWQLEAGCKNCTDDEYYHSTLNFGSLGFATQFPGLPRTWQASFRYNFGAL